MLLQHTALFGYGIAYTITASISCRYAHPLLYCMRYAQKCCTHVLFGKTTQSI
jgi:hypothetical protein